MEMDSTSSPQVADKDLLILKMKAANFELAIENMELQKKFLQIKIEACKSELAAILDELQKSAKGETT